MINFGIVVLLLPTCSREEYFGHALATEHLDEFTIIVESAVVEDPLHKQSVANILFLVIWRVPEQILMLVNNLLP